ncbi:15-hydroxyprostaglandin dehydrogenase [NAD(+)]-like [Ptychodera flava]|uniref:15-hydroxyprostaglandin dehydrogenase [NAD(+)]-like n=1 Tax=Ptychodera flava TaxID=63121 RepID=UPI00396A4A1A
MDIQDKVAMVTGAASGIGAALVEAFLKEGAKGVSVLDIDDGGGKDVCERLKASYGEDKAIYVHCDVTSKTDFKNAFEMTKANFGNVDILCNNAGILDEFNWESTLDINVKGVIMGTTLAVDFMGAKTGGTGGVVVNISSLTGLIVYPFMPVYSTTKASIIHFSRTVANEPRFLQNKVRVVAICPDLVDTPIHQKMTLRYMEQLNAVKASLEFIPMAKVIDTVINIIKDCDKENGAIYALVSDKPARKIEFSDFQR